MPVFQYEAKSYTGAILRGKIDAVDEKAVAETLRQSNYFPLNIKTYNPGFNVDISEYKRVGVKDLSIFCKQFAVIITAGITILKGIEIVRHQTENSRLKKILGKVLDDVQRGKSLSASMARHSVFPEMFIKMIEAGETSGTLDNIMNRMAQYYDKEYKLRQKIKQAVTYPLMIMIVAVGVITFLIVKVIPTFIDILASMGSQEALPLPTRIVIGLSNFVRFRWYVIIAGILIAWYGVRTWKKTESGAAQIDRFKLSMPLFGRIYKEIITSRFARTLEILMASGVPLMQSITICSGIAGNNIIRDALEASREQIKRGSGIGDTLAARGIFPLMLTQMIEIGEESGTLDKVLSKTSDFYDNEIEAATSQLTSVIEPIIIVFLGVIVGFIVLSILLPMFQMYDAVKSG